MNRFPEKISLSKLDGTYVKLLNQVEKAHLIIIDDFGLHPLDGVTRLALLQILEDRYGIKSTIITSQLPVAKFWEYIGESSVADYPNFYVMRSDITLCVVNHLLSYPYSTNFFA